MAPQDMPGNAVVLFDGTNFDNWTHPDGTEVQWTLEDGIMTVEPRTGGIVATENHADCRLHIEFRCPDMPDAEGQAKGNSGVFLQGRYEIQVLDSYGWEKPGLGDCGALYNQHAPLVNACLPPMEWQSYDVVFRAPRFVDAKMVTDARMTVLQNGVCIHNNVELNGLTGAHTDENVLQPGPLMLQDHGDLVSYRNIWMVHLPESGSKEYGPR